MTTDEARAQFGRGLRGELHKRLTSILDADDQNTVDNYWMLVVLMEGALDGLLKGALDERAFWMRPKQ